jgi:hypothetical protein
MFRNLDKLFNSKNTRQMLNNAFIVLDNLCSKDLKYLNIQIYQYDPDIAIEELGLEFELIDQLLEDYVKQIINSKVLFVQHIEKLKSDRVNRIELDYTPLRELAHKNLGVARNLRIDDAEKLLFRMMKDDDLNYLLKYLVALIASTVILKPDCAYNTITLLNTKKTT